MKDRIPTKILANGAIRYGVYDDAGTLLRYEYIKLEDEPTEAGDPLGKATLLKDITCEALDIPAMSVPDDAFFILSIGNNRGLVVATVYETGTTTPIDNVLIPGLVTATGSEVYTGENGVATGYTYTTSTNLQVSPEYVDLTVPAAIAVATPFGKKTTVTLYATRKTNSGYLETILTASKSGIRFTNKVLVDVHTIGGGYKGEDGYTESYGYGNLYSCGDGGASGYQNYATNIRPDPRTSYQAVVGAANGGGSSLLGVSGGTRETGGTGYIQTTFNNPPTIATPTAGISSTTKKYGTGAIVGGGSGGGGSPSNTYGRMAGGAPYGGAGALRDGSTPAANASGYGGGGGGGVWSDSVGVSGGSGYQGVVFYRWRYAS